MFRHRQTPSRKSSRPRSRPNEIALRPAAPGLITDRRQSPIPSMTPGSTKSGSSPARTNELLPEPLAPKTRTNARPTSACCVRALNTPSIAGSARRRSVHVRSQKFADHAFLTCQLEFRQCVSPNTRNRRYVTGTKPPLHNVVKTTDFAAKRRHLIFLGRRCCKTLLPFSLKWQLNIATPFYARSTAFVPVSI